jgi:branched-chain amino acid transport system substrate-binding protein
VGVILPLSGEKADIGKMGERALGLALEKINARRTEAGEAAIEFIVEDDGSHPEGARGAIERLIKRDDVVILTGGVSSNTAWVVAPIAEKHRIPFIVTSASADKITEQGWDYVFRLTPPASEHDKVLLSFMEEEAQPKTVAILHENSLWGLMRAHRMRVLLKTRGYETILKKGYDNGNKDFTALLDEVKVKEPEVIFLASNLPDTALLVRQARAQDIKSKLFVGSDDGLTSPEFYKLTGGVAESLITTRLWMPSVPFEGARAFAETFKASFDAEPDRYSAEAYAAAYVIDDALRRASSPEPKALQQSLTETNLMTIIGPLSFASYGNKTNQNLVSTYIVQWIDGWPEIVWPRQRSTAKYRLPR